MSSCEWDHGARLTCVNDSCELKGKLTHRSFSTDRPMVCNRCGEGLKRKSTELLNKQLAKAKKSYEELNVKTNRSITN